MDLYHDKQDRGLLLPSTSIAPVHHQADGKLKSDSLVWLCSCANMINAADRVLMPICIVQIAHDHAFSLHAQAMILSAFPLGYMSSQVIASCAAPQLGGRRVLLAVVVMWSLSTIVTPFVANSHLLLMMARLVLGLGEGLGLPTIYHLYGEHVPSTERTSAFAYLSASAGMGQTVAAVIAPHIPYQISFVACGLVGLIWCLLWLRLTPDLTDPPVLQPSNSLKTSNPLRRWRHLMTSPALWSIYIAHFAMNWTSYTVMHWLPTYLHLQMKADPTALSMAAAPYLVNSICAVAIGHTAHRWLHSRRMSLTQVRKGGTVLGLVIPAVFLVAFAYTANVYAAIGLITLCMASLSFNSVGHLANHTDVAPHMAGVTFAISNSIATVAGLLVGPFTSHLVAESHGRWWPAFVLAAMMNVCAAMAYLLNARVTQVV